MIMIIFLTLFIVLNIFTILFVLFTFREIQEFRDKIKILEEISFREYMALKKMIKEIEKI